MDIAPMNKTNIISYALLDLLLQLWNVSTSMRKRLRWMLKDKSIVVKKYDQRILILNGWMHLKDPYAMRIEAKTVKKGISNYLVETQEDVDILLSVNSKLRCNIDLKEPIRPAEFERVERLYLHDRNLNYYLPLSLRKVSHLVAFCRIQKIEAALKRINFINKLHLLDRSSLAINLKDFPIRKVEIKCLIQKWLILPSNLHSLTIRNSDWQRENLEKMTEDQLSNLYSNIYLNRVTKFNFYSDLMIIDKVLPIVVKEMKGLKQIRTEHLTESGFKCLPSSLRKIDSRQIWLYALQNYEFDKHLPNLISLTMLLDCVKINANVRETNTITAFKSDLSKLRRINSPFEPHLYKGSLESFENLKEIVVGRNCKLDILPSGIEKILCNRLNLESSFLTRLERES